MDDSDLLAFAPVPLRRRADGWTAERQRGFILFLAEGLRPGAAARRIGMSRKSAYALRARSGAAAFARAWDRALATASERRSAALPPTEYQRAVTGVLHPVRYRGRVVGMRRRFSSLALLRVVGRAARHMRLREGRNFLAMDDRTLSPSAPQRGP